MKYLVYVAVLGCIISSQAQDPRNTSSTRNPITERLDQLYSRIFNLVKDWADISLEERAARTAQEKKERQNAYHDIRELVKKQQPTVDDLIIAATLNEVPLLQLFLNAGVPINGKNRLQETALMAAARHGQPEAVEFLITHGADVFARNAQNLTARNLAEEAKTFTGNNTFANLNVYQFFATASFTDSARVAKTINILARAMRAATPVNLPMSQLPQPSAMPPAMVPRARL